MFKMREFTIILHKITDFKHFLTLNSKFFSNIMHFLKKKHYFCRELTTIMFMAARILLVFAILAIVIVFSFVGRNLYLRSQRLRRRLQMSAIYTNITHELLTPLTVISASVDKLRDEEPKFAHDYDLMQLNIQRMVRLLQQILETNKSEAGELKLLVAQGDVMKYIHETAECLEPLLAKKRQKFTIACQPSSMMGWIDTDKLDKIIYNLLSNAAKYSNEDGEVSLMVQTNKTYDHIRIEVSDTGDGIPPEQMKHLFQRFHDFFEPGILFGHQFSCPLHDFLRDAQPFQGGSGGTDLLDLLLRSHACDQVLHPLGKAQFGIQIVFHFVLSFFVFSRKYKKRACRSAPSSTSPCRRIRRTSAKETPSRT